MAEVMLRELTGNCGIDSGLERDPWNIDVYKSRNSFKASIVSLDGVPCVKFLAIIYASQENNPDNFNCDFIKSNNFRYALKFESGESSINQEDNIAKLILLATSRHWSRITVYIPIVKGIGRITGVSSMLDGFTSTGTLQIPINHRTQQRSTKISFNLSGTPIDIDDNWFNATPVLIDNTESNKTFYEGDTITINGSALDTDNGNIINIKYKINNGTTRAIATGISDGVTPLNYSKTLKYTANTLKDGDTVVASGIVDGQTYTITIWAEDDQGGKSQEVVRNFNVVPNRPPILTIDTIENQSNKINSEKIIVTGNVIDADNNDVTVSVRINNNASIQVYEGVPSTFTFDVKIADLIEGENTITVISKDTFDFTTTKTIKLNKIRNAVPVKEAIARYKINPPSGSAKQILAWVQREIGDLTVDADISMVLAGEQEQYSPMAKLTAPINDFIEEDEFAFEADAEKDNIVLKLKLNKVDPLSEKSIKQISGVLK